MTVVDPSAPAAFDETAHLWLEDVEGEAALAWVTAQNKRTLAELEADPRYAGLEASALEILNSAERIPEGAVRDGHVYNFWQDATNVRGLWRRTPLESYATEAPVWETLLDIDRLAADENANWVYKGSSCFRPEAGEARRCLISLSDGGKDAVVNREFDTVTKSFVEGGFETPEAKQTAVWAGPDTLLIATDWGEGTLTESGYPFIVKRWQRGSPLSEAEEIFRGRPTDVGVWPWTQRLDDGRILQGASKAETFFTARYFWFPEDGSEAVEMPLPLRFNARGVYNGQFLLTLNEAWSPDGQETFRAGDLVAFELEALLQSRAVPPISLVFRPGETQSIEAVGISRGAVLLALTDNVTGRLLSLDHAPGTGWSATPVALPGQGQVGIAFADSRETAVFLRYQDFLTPVSLLDFDTASGQTSPLKSLPPKFDTEGLIAEQFFAVSKDGTRVPYFLVRREDIPFDGTTPTLLYGYGGFQVSYGPSYSAVLGRNWLEQGGAYALANIRGGGEFGPAWHQAGLKQNRQRIYDDFIAVGEDLVARGVTAPRHLGIMGGSNGGLLMGVMLNQRPDLWNAVVVQVPLLDMLRYHLLLAGASWVDEYGSPEVPDERAFLETISPYHNFDATKPYPAPFFVTSTKDDRVHPGHARKLAKRFEEAGLPFYYFENMDGGHAAAADQTARAKRSALEYTYLARQLFPEPAADQR
ncbi:MAG: prolyl oligopeptidase family serine peptidase [Hyphomonas sp.]